MCLLSLDNIIVLYMLALWVVMVVVLVVVEAVADSGGDDDADVGVAATTDSR